MQSFNICCYSEHPHPPIFMSHCRLADINQPFSLFSRLKSINIGCKPWHLWTIGIKWKLANQWERWPIHLHLSLAKTLKYNIFWKNMINMISSWVYEFEQYAFLPKRTRFGQLLSRARKKKFVKRTYKVCNYWTVLSTK